MCGIHLVLGRDAISSQVSLTHRGPDQRYTETVQGGVIEFYRLAVTGADEGTQPVRSRSSNWSVFLNGEIYNFRQLQTSFRLPHSDSDTRTVADGLESVGIGFLHHLRGMFAGVAINRDSDEIYVFRDALGEKPLFVGQGRNSLVISSEFQSALAELGDGLHLSEMGIKSFLTFGYVEEPTTLDLRIGHVPRGSVLRIERSSGRLIHELTLEGSSHIERQLDLSELLNTVVTEATETQVDSVVALSGGLDSGALAGWIGQHREGRANRAITFFNPSGIAALQEYQSARTSARKSKLELSTVGFPGGDFFDIMSRVSASFDLPIGDPASFGYFQILKRARDLGFKVLLTGQGLDELFWGYPEYVNYFSKSNISQNRRLDLEVRIPSEAQDFGSDWVEYLRVRDFGSPDIFLGSKDRWQKARAYLAHSYLSHNGLAQADRISMSFSVEARSPWADSRLYGWAQAQNDANKPAALGKSLFKSAFSFGENSHITSHKKRGFFTPASRKVDGPKGAKGISRLAETLKKESWVPNMVWELMERSRAESYRKLVLLTWLERAQL